MGKCISRRGLIIALILGFALAQTGMAQDTITIGAIQPLTGPKVFVAEGVPLIAALKDLVAITNAEGGINGKKLQYAEEDDQFGLKPEVAQKAFETLMSKYNPLCVFGSGTGTTLALAPLIRKQYPVLYSSTSFSAKIMTSGAPSMFMIGPTYGDQFGVALKYIAQQKKGKKIAFFYSKGPLGEDPIPFGRIMVKRLRLKLVGEAIGNMRGGDHSAQIEELKSKNPDWVILHGWIGPNNGPIIKQCHELGLKARIVTTIWGAQSSVVKILGPDGPKFLAVSPYAYWWMEDVPMIRKLRAFTAKNHPDVTERRLPYVVAFTAGQVFVECLRKADAAGQLNAKGLTKVLKSLKNFDTGGLTPPLTIKENRFPIARILESDPAKGIFAPVSDWIAFY
jgi:branched-chain amino acid transport system substrate-binding protein